MYRERSEPLTASLPSWSESPLALLPGRTVAGHGLTGAELDRLYEAIRFMQLHCQRRRTSIWWLSTAKGTDRDTIAEIWKRITRLQRDQGWQRLYSVAVFEAGGGLHAHIVFIGNQTIADTLKRAQAFSDALKGADAVAPANDPEALVRRYLSKERTPQAGYRRWHELGGRIKKSHQLPGGGDRVRLSRELERDAVEAGFISRWQHTYASRSDARKSYSPRHSQRLRKTAPTPVGQLSLLPELERTVSRFREFGGGIVPPAVALEIEFRRRQHRLSQRLVGSLIGISQGQYANAMRGHDPISAPVVNRLRELLLDGRVPLYSWQSV